MRIAAYNNAVSIREKSMHPAILTELKKRWAAVKGNHESCHVAEYPEANWEAYRIQGDPSKAWVWNGETAEEVDPNEVKHVRKVKAGGVFVQAGLRYAFNPEVEGEILVEFVTGALTGNGAVMKVSGDGDALLSTPDGQKWGY
jgi:hypothetical protein